MKSTVIRGPVLALFVTAVVFGLVGGDLANAGVGYVSRGNGCSRVIALTFDDGPNPPFTQEIVGVLERYGARGTFFVEGEAAIAHPEMVNLLRDAGMAIGSHSYSHSEKLTTMPAADFARDLQSAGSALAGIVGTKPQFYRPPFGRMSATMLRELRKGGYVSVGWDVDSTDWRESDPQRIAARVLSEAHSGAIVLLHDGGLSGGTTDRSGTVEALPAIIDGLRARGYEFVTVPEIMDPKVCSASLR